MTIKLCPQIKCFGSQQAYWKLNCLIYNCRYIGIRRVISYTHDFQRLANVFGIQLLHTVGWGWSRGQSGRSLTKLIGKRPRLWGWFSTSPSCNIDTTQQCKLGESLKSQICMYHSLLLGLSDVTYILIGYLKQEGPKGPGSLTWGKCKRSQWSHLQRTTNVVHQILVEDL